MIEQPALGLYEAVHTTDVERRFARGLGLDPHFESIPKSDIPAVLARHVSAVVERQLVGKDADVQQATANEILAKYGTEVDIVVELDRLVSLHRGGEFRGREYRRPYTPLSETTLLTNAPGEPSLSFELKTELVSADQVDLLCAFIRFAGVRVIKEQLAKLREYEIPLRIITTTYRGVTERRALDLLVRELGAQVKISYDTNSTRLHAKAWLIKRDSGYDTGFIGSSNLSRTALLDGLEWNVRISSVATPSLIRKFDATFETYWNDPSFEDYEPDRDAERFDAAVKRAAGDTSAPLISGLEVHARPHQLLMLEALAAERVLHDRHRNLLIAATGTGKTVVAALDYRNLCEESGKRPTLLFVAHRKEILQQALRTYREVLSDGNFGELMVGGQQPSAWKHVFASVQSLSAAKIRDLPVEAYEVVVIDEFHHAAAPSYQALLDHLKPEELLGLTATPERTDGFDVRSFFDGRSAHELRLWDALDQDLLCPFHYYGVADNVDLSRLEWRRGGYAVEGLDQVYTGNDARARLILNAIEDRVEDPAQMRALGFCVSVAHAEYMADVFSKAGITAASVTGDTPPEDRTQALQGLRAGTVQAIFTVDVFNEGVDVPSLDTILLLRPTESATLFQQQLGRGLRRANGKAVLTVLDFIGQQRREFRFADRFRVLTGSATREIERQVDEGFGYLPSGAQIVLDDVSRTIVLANIRQSVRGAKTEQIRELRNLGDVGLGEYLRQTERSLSDVYAKANSWTEMRRAAGLSTLSGTDEEKALLKKVWRLTFVDDPERAHYYSACATPGGTPLDLMDDRGRLYATMLLAILWPSWTGLRDTEDGLERLRANPAACAEIREVIAYALKETRRLPSRLSGRLGALPLYAHASYFREEILIATAWAKFSEDGRSPKGHTPGAVWMPDLATDVFLVTLRKEAANFSPQTMYRDYAISNRLFHWESQNTTAIESGTGQRYVNHVAKGSNILIFARLSVTNTTGTSPYLCLGPATHVEHRGSRPIAITWKLELPMPANMLIEAGAI